METFDTELDDGVQSGTSPSTGGKTADTAPSSFDRTAFRRAAVVRYGLFLVLGAIVFACQSVASTWVRAKQLLDYAQTGVVILILLVVWIAPQRTLKRDDADSRRIHDSIEQFKNVWILLWAVWAFLYIFFSVQSFGLHIHPYVNAVVPNLCNNLQTTALVLMFYVLAKPTLPREQHKLRHWPLYVIVALVTIFELICQIAIEQNGAPQAQADASAAIFGMLSGLFAATGMALFVGRIETKFLRIPLAAIICLYIYAAIQPLFPLFRLDEQLEKHQMFTGEQIGFITYVLKSAALFGKYLLYVTIWSQIASGRLAHYMVKIRSHHDNLEKEWSSFEARMFQ